jgi:ABC-type phosphate transport system substrate-binding protein
MKATITAVLMAGVLAVSGVVSGQESGYKVIGHPSTTPDSVSKRDLTKVFLKIRTKWQNGQAAEPVDMKRSSAVRARFSEGVLAKSIAQVESHWQAQVFTGNGTPPKVLESDAAVLEFVRSKPGAVGYVSAGATTDGVKVLRVTD